MKKEKYINALLITPIIFSLSIICEALCFIPLGWTSDLFSFWGSFSWIIKHLSITVLTIASLSFIKNLNKSTIHSYIFSIFAFPILLISTQYGYNHLWFCPYDCESIALILLPVVFLLCAVICFIFFGIITYLFFLNQKKILIPIFIFSIFSSIYLALEKKIIVNNYKIFDKINNRYIELPFIKDVSTVQRLPKSKWCRDDSLQWEEIFHLYVTKNRKNNSVKLSDKPIWVNNCLNIKNLSFGLDHRGSFIAENCLLFAASYYNDKEICKYSNLKNCSCSVDIANLAVGNFDNISIENISNDCKKYQESIYKSTTAIPKSLSKK